MFSKPFLSMTDTWNFLKKYPIINVGNNIPFKLCTPDQKQLLFKKNVQSVTCSLNNGFSGPFFSWQSQFLSDLVYKGRSEMRCHDPTIRYKAIQETLLFLKVRTYTRLLIATLTGVIVKNAT